MLLLGRRRDGIVTAEQLEEHICAGTRLMETEEGKGRITGAHIGVVRS